MHLSHQIQAAFGNVAVNAFFVFVREDDVLRVGGVQHCAELVDHLLAVRGDVLALGRIKAEHAERVGAQDLRLLHGALERLQVLGKAFVHHDFAERGTDGGNAHARAVQHAAHFARLFVCKGGNVGAVHAADFNAVDASFPERLKLLRETRAGLVRKGGKNVVRLCHICLQIICRAGRSSCTRDSPRLRDPWCRRRSTRSDGKFLLRARCACIPGCAAWSTG